MRRDDQNARGAALAGAEFSSLLRVVRERARGGTAAWQELGERIDFLRGFIARPGEVCSVIPSSRVLERRLVRNARLRRARCVVELGPGTGGTTRAFLKAMPSSARLLAIELNETFAARLKRTIRDSRLTVVNGSAEDIERPLIEHDLPSPDAVISGIPFSTMPHGVGDRIAAAVARSLAPGGRFVAYQVSARVAERAAPHLGEPQWEWEFINIPPIRVYTWTRAG